MLILLAAILTVAVDQLTKTLAATGVVRAPWIDPAVNPDLALGVVGGPAGLEIAAAVIGIVLAWHVLAHRRPGNAWAILTGLAIGGAVGNLIDRALTGSVRDFIVAPYILFNVADVALLVGLAGCVLLWRRREPAPAAQL